ncbi:hypothetical protein Tco_1418626 [Tanacetum coccineum]
MPCLSNNHQGVADALAARDADRSRNGDDNHNSGTGSKRTERTARECTYTDFLKCQPMNFKGIEGVVGLTQWFERMETVFNISNCAFYIFSFFFFSREPKVKFATCTLHGVALTWWKSYVKIVGQDAAHNMPQNTLMKMMTAKYCPRNEINELKWKSGVEGVAVLTWQVILTLSDVSLCAGGCFSKSTRYHMKNQRLRAEHKINQKIAELKLVFSGVTSLRGRLLDIRKRLGHPVYFTVYCSS